MADRTISHYRLLGVLGEGGMGVVYKAEDTRLHRFVALKLLSDRIANDPSARERFHREAEAASALNHPGICNLRRRRRRRQRLYRDGVIRVPPNCAPISSG